MTREQTRKKDEQSDAEAIALIAAALLVGASAQATANSLSPRLGIPVDVLLPVLVIAFSKPLNYGVSTIPSVPASKETSDLEATFRAQYVLAAARRLIVATDAARDAALKREQRYFNQHLEATRNRRTSAATVDKAKRKWGNELGWHAKMDSITSEECKEANGRNFYADQMPPIGYPGTVHPYCRCRPGKPFATSKTVYTVKSPDRKVA